MADFVAVLRKTLEGLKDPSEEVRERVYAKARETIRSKLDRMSPKPPKAVIDRQLQALEEAISEVEASYVLNDLDLGNSEIDDDLLLDDIDAAPPKPAPAPAPRHDPGPRVEPALRPEPATRPDPLFRPEPALRREARPDPVIGAGVPPRKPVAPSPVATKQGAQKPDPDFDDDFNEDIDSDADLVGIDEPPPPPGLRGKQTDDDWEDEDEDFAPPRRAKGARTRRFRLMPVLVGLLALLLVGGGAYALWHYRDTLLDLAGSPMTEQPTIEDVIAEDDDSDAPAEPAATAPAEGESRKFTQRLLPDGSEVDPGPAGDEPRIGEGTSVAAASTGAEMPSGQAALPVGQKAIFYEERTASLQGSAEAGEVVWSLVQESPGGGLPPEPAIRAEATIPAKDIQFRMTIRRNADESLPASHIIEMIFLVPDDFEGGAIDNILRVAFKDSEQSPGNPLLGLPAKISDGFFLLALSDSQAETDANTMMMRRLDWLDIPIVYRSGRRALITLEKGAPGARVFEEALSAWANESSG